MVSIWVVQIFDLFTAIQVHFLSPSRGPKCANERDGTEKKKGSRLISCKCAPDSAFNKSVWQQKICGRSAIYPWQLLLNPHVHAMTKVFRLGVAETIQRDIMSHSCSLPLSSENVYFSSDSQQIESNYAHF